MLEGADTALNEAIGYTRSLMAELNPPVLRFGLPMGMKWLAEKFQTHHLAVKLDIPEAFELTSPKISQGYCFNARESAAATVRVLLVEDHAMVREGLRGVLDGYADIPVAGEAADGEEAIVQRRGHGHQFAQSEWHRSDPLDQISQAADYCDWNIGASDQPDGICPQEAGGTTYVTKDSAAASQYEKRTYPPMPAPSSKSNPNKSAVPAAADEGSVGPVVL